MTKTFDPFVAMVSAEYAFGTYGCICLIGAIFTFAYVPETKGKSLEQIEQELKGSTREANAV